MSCASYLPRWPGGVHLSGDPHQPGRRTVCTTRIPLSDLSVILTYPAKPDPDNRKVDINHAKGFGQYLADNPGWVAPALLIRDTGGCRFEPISEDGSVGYLTVPWSIGGIRRLITIDGQHRILGVHLEKKRITDEVSRVDREIHRADIERIGSRFQEWQRSPRATPDEPSFPRSVTHEEILGNDGSLDPPERAVPCFGPLGDQRRLHRDR